MINLYFFATLQNCWAMSIWVCLVEAVLCKLYISQFGMDGLSIGVAWYLPFFPSITENVAEKWELPTRLNRTCRITETSTISIDHYVEIRPVLTFGEWEIDEVIIKNEMSSDHEQFMNYAFSLPPCLSRDVSVNWSSAVDKSMRPTNLDG